MKSAVDDFLEKVRNEDLPDAAREDRILASTLSAAGMSSVPQVLSGGSKGTSSTTSGGLFGTGAAKVAGLAGVTLAVALPLWHFSSQQDRHPHEISPASSTQSVGSPLRDEEPPPAVETAEVPHSAPPRATLRAPLVPRTEAAPASSNEQATPRVPARSGREGGILGSTDSNSIVEEAPPALAPSLSEELKVLEKVQVALKRNKPREALRLLDELDGSPALEEERRAARVMASCLANRSAAAVKSSRDFVSRHPQSVHREAIERMCKPK